jgi:hypothetical protein
VERHGQASEEPPPTPRTLQEAVVLSAHVRGRSTTHLLWTLLGWSADVAAALLVAGYAIYRWWPIALEVTQRYGPHESGDIKLLSVLVFLGLGLAGSGLILGLSLLAVIAIMRLLPGPARAVIRVSAVVGLGIFLYVERSTVMFLLQNLVHGPLRRYGVGR